MVAEQRSELVYLFHLVVRVCWVRQELLEAHQSLIAGFIADSVCSPLNELVVDPDRNIVLLDRLGKVLLKVYFLGNHMNGRVRWKISWKLIDRLNV